MYLKSILFKEIFFIFLIFLPFVFYIKVFFLFIKLNIYPKATFPSAKFFRMGEICPNADPPTTTQKKVPTISEAVYFPVSTFQSKTYLPNHMPIE